MGRFANSAEDMRTVRRITAEAMGEEYNPNDDASMDVGTCIGPVDRRAPWHGQSGFEAMGHVVPGFRKAAGQETLKAMGFNQPGDSERRHSIVEQMANHLERDNSHAALENCLKAGVDATGCYRLMSVLLCEPEPGEEPAPEATYVDLMAA